METTALIPSCNVDKVLAERDAIVRHADLVHELVRSAPSGFPDLWVNLARGHERYDADKVKRDADRSGWWSIMQQSGLWDFMDHQARNEWRDSLEKGAFPPLTHENVEATITQVYHDRKAMMVRGVVEVYQRLDDSYKSNQPMRFGDRVILRWLMDASYGRYAFPNHTKCDQLDDLDRMIRVLRGLPEQTRERHAFRILSDATNGTGPWVAEFDFFTIKLWKNGNGHLTWKHQVDQDRLNKILALSGPNQIGGKQ